MLRQERAEQLLEEALEATRVDCPMTAGDVELECGHVLHFHTAKPHKKEILWCRRCRAERGIKALGDGKAYRVKCDTCVYTRGKDGELGAERAAAGHRAKRPHHVVHVLDHSGTIVRTFQDDPGVTYLSDLAPF